MVGEGSAPGPGARPSEPPRAAPPAPVVLVVDDMRNIRRMLDLVLTGDGFSVLEAESAEQALELAAHRPIDVVIADLMLPGMSGLELLTRLRADDTTRDVPVIVISGHATVKHAVDAIQLGASDFFEKPLARERVLVGVRNALDKARLARKVAAYAAEVAGRHDMLGSTPVMQRLFHEVERVAPTKASVLITGESGTGKELVAEALHAASSRAGRPFVRVNCAALVETLLTSELFGHERGAFTGADRQKKGRFELADGGTILLDEIGDVSPAMQAALLRVLQERTFERVGGTRTLRVDVRVIAATHRDLADRVAAGLFREDLYYRLSGITVRVPALRERRGDLPALTRHLLARIAKESGAEPKVLSPDALERLARHPWPGNVRELENVLRSASVLGAGRVLDAADFDSLGGGPPSSAPPPGDTSIGALMYERLRGGASIYALRKRLERDLVERALTEADGNISRAADLLGMKRPRLSKLVHEWGLKK